MAAERCAAGRIVPPYVFAQFLYRLGQIADMNTFRSLRRRRTLASIRRKQIVVVLVAIWLEVEILRHLGQTFVADAF